MTIFHHHMQKGLEEFRKIQQKNGTETTRIKYQLLEDYIQLKSTIEYNYVKIRVI